MDVDVAIVELLLVWWIDSREVGRLEVELEVETIGNVGVERGRSGGFVSFSCSFHCYFRKKSKWKASLSEKFIPIFLHYARTSTHAHTNTQHLVQQTPFNN